MPCTIGQYNISKHEIQATLAPDSLLTAGMEEYLKITIWGKVYTGIEAVFWGVEVFELYIVYPTTPVCFTLTAATLFPSSRQYLIQ
jgi:hypothetical protein